VCARRHAGDVCNTLLFPPADDDPAGQSRPVYGGNSQTFATRQFGRVTSRRTTPNRRSFRGDSIADWNGRFNGVGNGAIAGTISYSAMAPVVRQGFAAASTQPGPRPH
jgi:hypothetical protein